MQVQLSTSATPTAKNVSFISYNTVEKTYSLARKIIEGTALILPILFPSEPSISLDGRG